MSRSQPTTRAMNPAKQFFEYSAGRGTVEYYDKDKGERVPVKMPFRFMVLDQLWQVSGGRRDGQTYRGFYSNAVRRMGLRQDPFKVFCDKQPVANGLWADIKTQVQGLKLAAGLYIAYHDESGELSLGHLKLDGAALSSWIDFTSKGVNPEAGVITLRQGEQEKAPTGVAYYYIDLSQSLNVTDETEQAALALDRDVLAPYLRDYFTQRADTDSRTDNTDEPAAMNSGGDFSGMPPAEDTWAMPDDIAEREAIQAQQKQPVPDNPERAAAAAAPANASTGGGFDVRKAMADDDIPF